MEAAAAQVRAPWVTSSDSAKPQARADSKNFVASAGNKSVLVAAARPTCESMSTRTPRDCFADAPRTASATSKAHHGDGVARTLRPGRAASAGTNARRAANWMRRRTLRAGIPGHIRPCAASPGRNAPPCADPARRVPRVRRRERLSPRGVCAYRVRRCGGSQFHVRGPRAAA